MSTFFRRVLVVSLAMAGFTVHSQVVQAATAAQSAQPSSEASAIEAALKRQFDRPEAPLKVAPVAVEGQYAVAGWVQQGRGGRALLKKEAGHWVIQACGGDGLRQAANLELTGMDAVTAKNLAIRIQKLERSMPADWLKKLSMFEGVMAVDAPAHHGHSTHPPAR